MNRELKEVLFISGWYPNRVRPTLGNFVQKHAEAVAMFTRVNVLHVCFDPGMKQRKESIHFIENNVSTYIVYLRKPRVKLLKPIMIMAAYFSAYKKLYAHGCNASIIHGNICIPGAMIACLLSYFKRIPFILTEHWTGFLPEDPNKPGRFWFTYRMAANRAQAFSPVTENLATAMKSYGLKGFYKIIPNVTDTAIFTPATHNNSGGIRILHVSTLDDTQKNFSGILHALAVLKKTVPDFTLELISDGDYDTFKPLITKIGLNESIHYSGVQDTAGVALAMQQSDFLLLFSNYENFPCVISEAMACGLPVLSSDTGGIAEHLHPDKGMLVPARDNEALTSALAEMCIRCRSFNRDGIRKYAEEHFSYHSAGKKYIDLYRKILNP